MPPKKNKKKGKGTARKSPFSKGAGSPMQDEITFKEAVLQYRLQLKHEQISDLKKDVDDLTKLYNEQKQRNEALNSKKENMLNQVASKVNILESEKNKVEAFDFEVVEKALLETFYFTKAEDSALQEEEEKIDLIESLIDNQIKEIRQRCQYRDLYQFEDDHLISSLENEREAMNTSFCKISGQLQANISEFKEEISNYAGKALAEQQAIAEKEVIQSLDTANQIELISNSLLKDEILLHEKLYHEELKHIESLEEDNLSIIEDLLDCNLADIKVMRRFYDDCSGDKAVSQPRSDDVVELFDTEVNNNQNNKEDTEIGDDVRLLCVIGKQKPIQQSSVMHDNETSPLMLDFDFTF